jgi:biofilm protein TabA
MIIDQTANSRYYESLSPDIQKAFRYLQQAELSNINIGRFEIEAEKIYAVVQQYNTKPLEQGVWEAHRRYIDLQVIIQGSEKIAYCNIGRLRQGEYEPGKDFLPLSGKAEFLTLEAGDFMLLFPQDAHMPGIAVDSPAPVKKIVLKIGV